MCWQGYRVVDVCAKLRAQPPLDSLKPYGIGWTGVEAGKHFADQLIFEVRAFYCPPLHPAQVGPAS